MTVLLKHFSYHLKRLTTIVVLLCCVTILLPLQQIFLLLILRHTEIAVSLLADSDTTFKVKRSKVNLQERGNTVADSRTSLIINIH